MPDYIQHLFNKDGAQAKAARTGLALSWPLPGLRQTPPLGLPPSQAALAGWRKLVPGHARPPLPREALLFLAQRLLHLGHAETALCILLAFEAYFRSSGMLTLG